MFQRKKRYGEGTSVTGGEVKGGLGWVVQKQVVSRGHSGVGFCDLCIGERRREKWRAAEVIFAESVEGS